LSGPPDGKKVGWFDEGSQAGFSEDGGVPTIVSTRGGNLGWKKKSGKGERRGK